MRTDEVRAARAEMTTAEGEGMAGTSESNYKGGGRGEGLKSAKSYEVKTLAVQELMSIDCIIPALREHLSFIDKADDEFYKQSDLILKFCKKCKQNFLKSCLVRKKNYM